MANFKSTEVIDTSGNIVTTTGNALDVNIKTASITQPVSLASTTITGTVAVTGTFFQATQPVSGTVAVTQSTSPWIVAGGGTAGTPGTAVLTVQGISGGTPQPVSLTSTTVTGSVAVTNAGTFLVQAAQATAASLNATVVGTGTFAVQATLAAETTKVIGTVNQGTSPWVCSLASTTVTGTVAVTQSGTWTVGISAAQTIAVTQATASSLNATVVQGTAASLNATVVGTGTFAVQAAQSGTWNVGTVTTVGTVSAITAMPGSGATGSAVPAGADYEGLFAVTSTFPTAATPGNLVGAMGDKAGRAVQVINSTRELTGAASLDSSSSSAVSFIASGGASVFTDITELIITNDSATATIVTLSDGTATYKFAINANGGLTKSFLSPLPATSAATAWTVLNSAAVSCHYIAVYAKNK